MTLSFDAAAMGPSFGTSGLRGLVTELTPACLAAYCQAFVRSCATSGEVHIGWDLRPSSPVIAESVAQTLVACGCDVVVHGPLPTPALALAAWTRAASAIMVTGSHIPADRNGLKFYTPTGEITKAEEAGILAALDQPAVSSGQGAIRRGKVTQGTGALAAFSRRYLTAFGPQALAGLRIGVYQHSSVARDLLLDLLTALGAQAVPLGRSDMFIPLDTEALDPATRAQIAQWCGAHGLDALVSADGDADRPLVSDSAGHVIAGDVLGALTAQALQAQGICAPVSANSGIDLLGAQVVRTRIGSPYVIAAMAAHPAPAVVGFEANGGFLLGFTAEGPTGPLPPLMTRDFALPIVAPLALARARGVSLGRLCATLPARFTAADRLPNVPRAATQMLLAQLETDEAARGAFFAGHPPVVQIDLTDGLRLRFANDEIVHLRASGNAPECRCYAEAHTFARAEALVAEYLGRLRTALAAR